MGNCFKRHSQKHLTSVSIQQQSQLDREFNSWQLSVLDLRYKLTLADTLKTSVISVISTLYL